MLGKLRLMAAVLLLMCSGLFHQFGYGQVRPTPEPVKPQHQYYSLMDTLFNTYKPEVRPTTSGDVTVVFVAISLKSIQNLDEKSQVLESSIIIDAEWNDDFLAWNESDFGGISSFFYQQKNIWRPDIIIENSIESQSMLGYDENFVRIDNEGYINWRAGEVIRTGCDIDVTYYPFDTQTCVVVVSTWMSTQEDVIVFPIKNTKGISMSNYRPSGTWDIVFNEMVLQSNNDNATRLVFTLKLKRLKIYYVLNIILPLIFLSFTASMVFFLPADAGEKIGMGITVLLAYAVYLSIIADNMPQTSLQVSYLAVYITLLLGLTAMGVVLAVVVLHIHHKSDDCKIGKHTEKITRKLRALLGISKVKDNNGQETNELEQSQKNLRGPSRATITPYEDKATRSISRQSSYNGPEEISWPKVAETVDRIMFFLSSGAILLITLIFFPILMQGN